MVVCALLVMGSTMVLVKAPSSSDGGEALPTFSSYSQMSGYVSNSNSRGGYDAALTHMGGNGQAVASEPMKHSNTNVQVEGVDEADLVKTNGQYLFIASLDRVYIVRTYPPAQMSNVSEILVRDHLGTDANYSVWIHGIYLFDGELAIIASVAGPYPVYDPRVMAPWVWRMPEERTMVMVFDLSDVAQPQMLGLFGISGNPSTTRLAGGIVYAVAQHFIWTNDDSVVRPKLWINSLVTELDPTRVHYDPDCKDSAAFLNLLAVDLKQLKSNYTSLLVGYASIVYMSQGALYLTYQKWTGEVVWSGTGAGGTAVSVVSATATDSFSTTIYKIRLEGLVMQPNARGSVPGWPLNQFALDEHGSQLRIATTTSWTNQSNAVYILDADLKRVGQLENIAPGERIYSARFDGETLYLVTFRQVDPLFVIDLSVASDPRIVGSLELPGFSSYLHPVNSTHLVGIGMLNGSVKLSLFDVSDPLQPREDANLTVPGWSYSQALWDHHAVLFDAGTGTLIIPITTYDATTYNVTSAAFVFHLAGDTIALAGKLAVDSGEYIVRTHYIGEYLYTITDVKVLANSLLDLSPAGELVYAERSQYLIPRMLGEGPVSPVAVVR